MSGVQRLTGTTLGSLNIVQNKLFVIETTGAATATLPDGNEGDRVYILLAVRAGDLVISGDFETGTSATMNAAKDALELLWIANLGWMTVSNQGTVIFA
jgi:hypothetical protein